MLNVRWTLVFALLALVALAGSPLASAEEKSAAGDESAAPATVVVKLGPLGDAVKTKGSIVPASFERAACELESYRGPLEIVEAVPEGPVVKGQTLVRFSDETYREQLVAKERSFALARIKLQKAEIDARLRPDETAASLDSLVRKKRLADEALERFETVERKMLEEGKIYSFQGRRNQIQNMREELAQLQKMYTEDDLTEETEEIVLKRNKRNFERMLQSFEWAKKRHEYDMKVDLPRRHESLRASARKARQSLERFQSTMALDKEAQKLGLEKAREDFAKAEEDMAEFRADGEKLTVKAPIAGYAVRGTFAGGSWKSLASPKSYEPGEDGFKSGQTLYTVVDEGKLRVETSIKEADLAHVKAGLAANVTTAVTGKQAFEGEVAVVARYGTGGKYAVTLRLKSGHVLLRAGLSCSVEISKAAGGDVLSVPAACVLMEKDKAYVFVAGEEEPVKTAVKVGRKAGGRVVLTDGVKAGQRLLAAPPKAK